MTAHPANKRNGTIDFMKFVFAIIIILFHGNDALGITGTPSMLFPSGRLAVEFFFVVSGYMLAHTCETRSYGETPGKDTFGFIKNKILRFCPDYYVAFALAFIVFFIFNPAGFLTMVLHFLKSFPELLFLGQFGFQWEKFNGVTWYLSAMILSMIILYPLMKKLKDRYYYIVAPLIFLLGTGLLFSIFGDLSDPNFWMGFCYKGAIRAIAEIAGGTLVYKFTGWLKKYRFTNFMKTVFFIIEILAYLAAIYVMFKYEPSNWDFFALFCLMIGITISLSNASFSVAIFRSKVFSWMGELSFSLFLGHHIWKYVLGPYFPESWSNTQKMLLYFIIAFISGLFIMYFSKLLKFIWKKISPAIKRLIVIQ